MSNALIVIIMVALATYLILKRTDLFRGGSIGGSLPGTKTRKDDLREQCRGLLKMPADEADKVIDRLIERQKEKNPGQSEEWYLDKILYDLKKDKHR